jgi:hypothetical protein
MGGFFSGSLPRSTRSTTDEFLSLDIRALSDVRVMDIARAHLAENIDANVEVEVAAISRTQYQCRVSIGTQTRSGFTDGPLEVNRAHWMAETSMFLPVVATRPHFGGLRLWFRCPRSRCGRRCSILYRARDTNARALACRWCYRLDYETQRMSRVERLSWRAGKRLSRLEKVSEHEFIKPKRMRRATFARIVAEVEALDRAADTISAPSVNRLVRTIRRVTNSAESAASVY